MSTGDPELDALMASTSQLRTESPPARSFNMGGAIKDVEASAGATSSASFDLTQGNVPFSNTIASAGNTIASFNDMDLLKPVEDELMVTLDDNSCVEDEIRRAQSILKVICSF